jgi:ABC-type antimicrobial peptide transport system permease subunit
MMNFVCYCAGLITAFGIMIIIYINDIEKKIK